MKYRLWEFIPGFHAGNLPQFSPHDYWGIFDRFSLRHGSTDESNDIQTDGNFPGNWNFRKFHTAILVGIFTMHLADHWIDQTDDRHTDRWMDFQVKS